MAYDMARQWQNMICIACTANLRTKIHTIENPGTRNVGTSRCLGETHPFRESIRRPQLAVEHAGALLGIGNTLVLRIGY